MLYEEDGVTIKGATKDELVDHCLGQFVNGLKEAKPKGFVALFFVTYRWFMTTEELLHAFSDQLDGSKYGLVYQQKAYRAVKFWLKNYGSDFEKNNDALSLLDEMNVKVKEKLCNGTAVSLDLDDWFEAKRVKNLTMGEEVRKKSLNFNDMNGSDFGEQLMYLCYKGIRKIPLNEWKLYGKSAKTKNTPVLKEQITLFNDISKYVMAMVLSHESAELRAKSIHKFVDMARRLLELNDFNTVMAVIGGLGHSTVTRLHRTRDLLSSEDKLFLKETHEMLSSDSNYARYRSEIEDVEGFILPVLTGVGVTQMGAIKYTKTLGQGIIMKDLVALETAVNDFITDDNGKYINFHKMTQLSNILQQVLVCRETPPDVLPKRELINIIRVSLKSRYTEDDLYDLSLQREPRDSKSSCSRTPSMPSSQMFFADWASGLIDDISNRETVEKHVKAMVEAVFKTYDSDKNGSISKEEFDALATNFPILDNFAVLDINCDGSISQHEMLNYFMNANSQEMTKEFLHDFQEQSFYSPHFCVFCMGFLWGIGKSGYRCKVCHITCHRDCKSHVVMECKSVRRSQSLRGINTDSTDNKRHWEKSSKSLAFKKRQKSDWKGSIDSQFSYDDGPPSPLNEVFGEASPTLCRQDMRVRERVMKLEVEKAMLKKENGELKSQLSTAETTINELRAQLGLVRHQSVRFMLEQMERLNTCKETDV